MKKQSEKRQTAIKQISDLHPMKLMSRVFDFSAIYQDFKSSKAEFVIFIREKKAKAIITILLPDL
jgi:hypothetical protein